MTVRDIRNRTDITDPDRVKKARQLTSYYSGVASNGDLIFTTPSQTLPSVTYTQYVRLLDLPTLRKSPYYRGNDRKMLADALKGNIAVYCTDPSFLFWGWQYISYSFGFGLEPAKFPKIRNPKLRGAVCKHIYHVLMVLPFNTNKIFSDMKRSGYLSIGGGL